MFDGCVRTFSLAAILVFSPIAFALPASELLEKGIYTEETAGDLDAAIGIYETIVEKSEANRVYAAQAQYRIGMCYLKKGWQVEAAEALRKVIDLYPNQRAVLALARISLGKLEGGPAGAARDATVIDRTYTLTSIERHGDAWNHLFRPTPFDFSPDGERMVFSGPLEGVIKDQSAPLGLYVSDRTGNRIRALLDTWGPRHGNSIARWSPDGRVIAFTARNRVKTESGEYVFTVDLYVIDPEGGLPRKVGADISALAGLCWTADGQHLTYLATGGSLGPNGVCTVDIRDDSVEFTAMKFHYATRLGGYSPDGRWLVFEIRNEGAGDRLATDVWILPTNGRRALQLTYAKGFDGHPEWSRDGRAIYFVSNREGGQNLWKVRLDPETGSREGKPEQVTFFSDANVLYPYILATGGHMAFVVSKNTSSLQVATATEVDKVRTVGRGKEPQLSPDGDILYYVGEGPGQQGIFAMPSAGGAPRKLTGDQPLNAFNWGRAFHLSPDGRALAYFSRVDDRTRLFVVATKGLTQAERGTNEDGSVPLNPLVTKEAQPRSLVTIESKEQLSPAWSPDGSLIAYASGDGLYTIPVEGGPPRKLAHLWSWDGGTVRWSPDGKHLAALGWTGPDAVENSAFVIPASGGEPQGLVVDNGLYKEGLEWHPDGQSITYFEYGHELTQRVYLDGRPSTTLFDQPKGWEYLGRWAPDGGQYVFISSSGGIWNSYAYDVGSGEIDPLDTNSEGDVSLPSWSDDGQIITWSTTRKTGQLWLMENFR